MDQYLFYQHNVQQYFLRHKDHYAGVVVPLSIAVSFMDGTNGFLRALFAQDNAKIFFIDPRSALFQKGWSRENLRKPHVKMAGKLGPLFQVGLERPISEDDLSTDALEEATKHCIEFQQYFNNHQPEQQRKLNKYAKLADIDELPTISNPQDYVPPYFMSSAVGDEFYKANMHCIKAAAEIQKAENLRPILHIQSPESVNDWDVVAKDLSSLGISKVSLYPNFFKEHEATSAGLAALLKGIEVLSKSHIDVLQLHGGYFSICLHHKGLKGFGNGVGYGEWRDSGYNRGGTAEKRIYIPRIHRFLEPTKAETLLKKDPQFFCGSSEVLLHHLDSYDTLANLTLEESLDDFMNSRRHEIDFVTNSSEEDVANELLKTVERLKAVGELELEEYGGSLARWASFFKQSPAK